MIIAFLAAASWVAFLALAALVVLLPSAAAVFDAPVASAAASLHSPFLEALFRLVTLLGSEGVVIALAVIFAVWLWRTGRNVSLRFFMVQFLVAGLCLVVFKSWFARERPDVFPLLGLQDPSFPSGHALMSTTLYGAFAYWYWRMRCDARVFVAAGFLAVIIGVSRLVLGVHWFTDVLAGWALGLALLCTGITFIWAKNKVD